MSRYEHFELPWSIAKSEISIATDYPSTAPPTLVETIKQSVVDAFAEKSDLFQVVVFILNKVKQY